MTVTRLPPEVVNHGYGISRPDRRVTSVSAFALMAAAPAQADEPTYLQRLLPKYASLNPQQLLAEGARVCRADRSGTYSADTVKMGYNDLALSMAAAVDIVIAAADELHC